MNKFKVSVIIPTYNRNEPLINTVKDLLVQDYTDFEIIIIDQTDDPDKRMLNFFKSDKRIKYYHSDIKSSPHARNIGVEKSQGEIILFFDDDIEINDKSFIAYHIENYNDPKIGLVGGRVVSDFKVKPKFSKAVGQYKYLGLKEVTNFDSVMKVKIDHAPGGNMSCYKKIFLKVGGFSDFYKGNAHMEETDFCLRVKRAGYELIFEPKAVIKHLQYPSGGNRVRDEYRFKYWLVRNFTLFYLKNYPKVFFPLYSLRFFTLAFLALIKNREIKMFKSKLLGFVEGIKDYQGKL